MESSTKTALIIGGVAAAALGLYLYTKKSATPAAGAGAAGTATQGAPKGGPTAANPVNPALPAPTSPATPAVKPAAPIIVTPPAGTGATAVVPAPTSGAVFNEIAPNDKVALWNLITPIQLDMSQAASNMYGVTSTPATDISNSAATILMNLNSTQSGNGLYIMSASDGTNHTFYAGVESDAVAQASGASPSWTVFLRPNEWAKVAEAAYAQTLAAQGGVATTPPQPSIPQVIPGLPTSVPTSIPAGMPTNVDPALLGTLANQLQAAGVKI